MFDLPDALFIGSLLFHTPLVGPLRSPIILGGHVPPVPRWFRRLCYFFCIELRSSNFAAGVVKMGRIFERLYIFTTCAEVTERGRGQREGLQAKGGGAHTRRQMLSLLRYSIWEWTFTRPEATQQSCCTVHLLQISTAIATDPDTTHSSITDCLLWCL